MRTVVALLTALALCVAAPAAHAYMADYGESYYAVPVDGAHNQATCRQIVKGRTVPAFRNPCRLPPQPIIRGTGRRP
jgi:hypothetical protein